MRNFKLLSYVVVFTIAVSCKSQQQKADENVDSTPERTETRTQQGEENQQEERGVLPSADILIRSMDVDGDGKLSRTEYRGRLAERFDDLDTDSDGFITKTELENAPKTPKR